MEQEILCTKALGSPSQATYRNTEVAQSSPVALESLQVPNKASYRGDGIQSPRCPEGG